MTGWLARLRERRHQPVLDGHRRVEQGLDGGEILEPAHRGRSVRQMHEQRRQEMRRDAGVGLLCPRAQFQAIGQPAHHRQIGLHYGAQPVEHERRQRVRALGMFAERDRYGRRRCQRAIAGEVVGGQRLLHERDIIIGGEPHQAVCGDEIAFLVGIDEHLRVAGQHGGDRLKQITVGRRAGSPRLHCAITIADMARRHRGGIVRRLPGVEFAAAVDRHGAGGCSPHGKTERHGEAARIKIPRRDVDGGERDVVRPLAEPVERRGNLMPEPDRVLDRLSAHESIEQDGRRLMGDAAAAAEHIAETHSAVGFAVALAVQMHDDDVDLLDAGATDRLVQPVLPELARHLAQRQHGATPTRQPAVDPPQPASIAERRRPGKNAAALPLVECWSGYRRQKATR